jgi:hypothetical protein
MAERPEVDGHTDPFAVLGVTAEASDDELRAARRKLAKELHPDHAGGDTEAMRAVNAAYERAMGSRAPGSHRSDPEPDPAGTREPVRRPGPADRSRIVHDVASFTIEALPAEAFEALLIAATWLGEPLADEPPYQLDVVLGEPFECWCRLDLVPDAGASTVAVTLGRMEARPLPDIDSVRDAWVVALNTLGRPDDS